MKKTIKIGNLILGGGNLVRVQSMANTDTRDVEATVAQILDLESEGCEIIRVAVPDMVAANAIKAIKDRIHIPLVADIHFDYRLAIKSVEEGADCIRINPGNLGGEEKTKLVIDAVRQNNACMRVGVNSGSLEEEFLKSDGVTASALAKSALKNSQMILDYGFDNFKVSLKASSVPLTIEAYKIFSSKSDMPLHIGVTEAGTTFAGTIKSSVGIGTLLSLGIGDTLRVSLTAEPIQEVHVGWQILQSLDLRRRGVNIVSCPTCGRTEIDLIKLAERIEVALNKSSAEVTIAVMGCAVNGPGEAKHADFGVAGGRGVGVIFAKGEIIRRVKESELYVEFIKVLSDNKIL